MNLCDFVVRDAILPDAQVSSKDEVIRQMIDSLKACGSISEDDSENIVSAILKREELGSTGIGNGIAVPHTKHNAVGKLIATVALVKDGVDFASLDGEDVYILFLLISPKDQPGDHLRALETVSRHLRSPNFCSFLRQSSTIGDVWELLKEADEDQLA